MQLNLRPMKRRAYSNVEGTHIDILDFVLGEREDLMRGSSSGQALLLFGDE